ncbi:MAG: hypothetical protein K5694_01845 [Bacilli bacterium]|nr:hypothetical protein [Bacilli bacterium]
MNEKQVMSLIRDATASYETVVEVLKKTQSILSPNEMADLTHSNEDLYLPYAEYIIQGTILNVLYADKKIAVQEIALLKAVVVGHNSLEKYIQEAPDGIKVFTYDALIGDNEELLKRFYRFLHKFLKEEKGFFFKVFAYADINEKENFLDQLLNALNPFINAVLVIDEETSKEEKKAALSVIYKKLFGPLYKIIGEN